MKNEDTFGHWQTVMLFDEEGVEAVMCSECEHIIWPCDNDDVLPIVCPVCMTAMED